MKNILFITGLTLWSMGKGNGGPAFTQTVRKYLNEGWNVYIISDEPRNMDYPELDKEHNLLIKQSPFKKLGRIRKLGLLFRWLDHLVASKRFCDCAEGVLCRLEGETILYAYEIFGVRACTKLAARHSLAVVSRFQGTILGNIKNTMTNRIRNYPHFQALRQKTNLVIMTDDGTQGDRVLRELGNDEKCLFLRNGLDLMARDTEAMCAGFDRQAFRAELGVEQKETMILTVSRLVSWKKVDRVIRGVAQCVERGAAVKLVVVGDGDSKNDLIALAGELGIREQVIFTSSVPHERVYSYMMACDIFASFYDLSNVGNPLLEAMTLGKCIATLNVGDTYKLIKNKENGIILDYQDLPQLGDVFCELILDIELRQRLGRSAAAFAQAQFYDWQTRMNTEYEAIECIVVSNC